jgi:hypothetical protein
VALAKFLNPPSVKTLQSIPAVIHSLKADTEVARIFFAGGSHPTTWDAFRYFGPTSSRFDHHQLQAGKAAIQNRGVMYLAEGQQSIPTCLAEIFQATRIIDRHHKQPVLAIFKTTKDLALVDLRGTFCTTLGASTAIHSGPRPKAQRWSAQLYSAYPAVDGLYYCSSMYGNAPAIALYERAQRAIPARPLFHRSLNDLVLHQIIMSTGAHITYGIV